MRIGLDRRTPRPWCARVAVALVSLLPLAAATAVVGCQAAPTDADRSLMQTPPALHNSEAAIYVADLDQVVEATKQTVRDLYWAVLGTESATHHVTIEGLTPADKRVRIIAAALTPNHDRTRVSVRVGYFGDEAAERRFHQRLRERLADQPRGGG